MSEAKHQAAEEERDASRGGARRHAPRRAEHRQRREDRDLRLQTHRRRDQQARQPRAPLDECKAGDEGRAGEEDRLAISGGHHHRQAQRQDQRGPRGPHNLARRQHQGDAREAAPEVIGRVERQQAKRPGQQQEGRRVDERVRRHPGPPALRGGQVGAVVKPRIEGVPPGRPEDAEIGVLVRQEERRQRPASGERDQPARQRRNRRPRSAVRHACGASYFHVPR